MMKFDVFISHPHENKATADAVCALLEGEGIRCWIAPRDIVHGSDFGASIIYAINHTKVMVLVFSAHANASPHVMREVERAVHKGVPVIPMRIEDVPLSPTFEYLISTTHWLDALTPPIERHLHALARSVKALLAALPREAEDEAMHIAPEATSRVSGETDHPESSPGGFGSPPTIDRSEAPPTPAFSFSHSSKGGRSRGSQTIVLILPELLGDRIDQAQLRKTLTSADGTERVRAILCLPDQRGASLMTALAGMPVDTEILLGPTVPAPTTNAYGLRAPPGTSPDQQIEFALALSDAVLFAAGFEQNPWLRAANALGKRTIKAGEQLPRAYFSVSTFELDPGRRGLRHALGRSIFGRLEQFFLELFAVDWRKRGGVAQSWWRMRRCVGLGWGTGRLAYFAAPAWPKLAPDRSALESSDIVARFSILDHSAIYGSFIDRDLVWLEHIGAAFAVFAAVAGHLDLGEHAARALGWTYLNEHIGFAWAIVELAALVAVVVMVMLARSTRLQDRWTACRRSAEQLRIALMSMPLLVLPSALATTDKPPAADAPSRDETQRDFFALMQLKRIVRDHGLPQLDPNFTIAQAAEWLHLIIRDQIVYHRHNHAKLERAESGLRFFAKLIFVLAMVAVVAHFWVERPSLLLATAALPAFAAALHATGTRLGIARRAALSGKVAVELAAIDDDLLSVEELTPGEEAWTQVRRLAFAAAESMGREYPS